MANQISLSAGTRQNLLLLQQTAASLSNTQLRLSTGNKINSALDGPQQFFAAQSLNQRAGDLDNLKDGIGQAISTLKAGDSGITQIQSFLDQAQGITTEALSNLGNDAASVNLRNNLANQYNSLLRQIDKLAQDSGYAGKNLLVGSGLQLNATASSKLAVNAIGGISGATASNVTRTDTYTIQVTGDGAISGSTADVQAAEQARGISNLTLTGFDSSATGNFDAVSIKLAGGRGRDKTFTVSEGNQSQTITFTQAQFAVAHAQGQVLHASVSFASGTKVNFDVDFNAIENTPDTAGVGTSVVEKLVNLQVKATNSAGETVVRDGLNLLGQSKTSNGENAFAFDSGTARVTIDERQILQGSTYSQAVSGPYGVGAAALAASPVAQSASTVDASYTVLATGHSFNYATNTFDGISASLLSGISAGPTVIVSANNASNVTLIGKAGTTNVSYSLDFNYGELQHVVTAAAANSAEAAGTNQINASTGALATSATVVAAVSAGATVSSGFVANKVTTVSYQLTAATGSSGTVTFNDGLGGTVTVAYANANSGAVKSVSAQIVGGVNNGAHVQLSFTTTASATTTAGDSITGSFKVRGAYNATDAAGQAVTANFDVRKAQTAATAQLQTQQLVDGNEANNLTVQLNETNTHSVTVISQNVQTDGQGLKLDQAQNGFNDRADIDNAVKQIAQAKLILRSASSNLSTNLNVIQTRETFTEAFSNVLKEGAGKLTLADQNEEGANLLTLQTRNQLGTISLSLANQAQQAILRLF